MDNNINKRFDLTSYTKAKERMIATNSNAYVDSWFDRQRIEKVEDYKLEDVVRILNSGSLLEQKNLSRQYFSKNNFYRRIIIHYSTLLMYSSLLIPKMGYKKDLKKEKFQKKYFQAMNFIESNDIPSLCTNWAIRCLRDGGYYGIIQSLDNETLSIIDLPPEYCRSDFKDSLGNDIIEFDLNYFYKILDENKRNMALQSFPKFIQQSWRQYVKGNTDKRYVLIPVDSGICFPFLDGRPPFLGVIPAIINYQNSIEIEQERALEEIRKILIQKIPHLNDGTLLFEPEEAVEIHEGSVQMMRGNKNLNVLTTYADVEVANSRTSMDGTVSITKNMAKAIFEESGTSSQLFGSDSNTTLDSSLKNDMAFSMIFTRKFAKFITYILNKKFGINGMKFKFSILPISYYNVTEYTNTTFKLASTGYSFVLPILGLGLSQGDLGDIKDLENNILELGKKLFPLSSAYNQSSKDKEEKEEKEDDNKEKNMNISGENLTTDPLAGSPGAPTKKGEQKAATTVAKEKSNER